MKKKSGKKINVAISKIKKSLENRKSNNSLEYRSYPELYIALINFIRKEYYWRVFVIASFLAFVVVFLPVLTLFEKEPIDIAMVLVSIFALCFALTVFMFVGLIIFLVIAGVQNPEKKVIDLVFRLFLIESCPHSGKKGLEYSDIIQLKRVAETERDSSDWRSSFVNWAIIGVVSFIVATWAFWEKFISTSNQSPVVQSPWTSIVAQITPAEKTIQLILIALLILWVISRWFAYFRDFLASESANRAILLSCDEAIFAIEKLELVGRKELSFDNRKHLVEFLGYRAIKYDDATFWGRITGYVIKDSKNQRWMFHPTLKK